MQRERPRRRRKRLWARWLRSATSLRESIRSGSPSAGRRVGVPRGTLRAGGAVEAGRRPRPRVPMTALGRRGSGAPLGSGAGPTPTAAVTRSMARRKSGAAAAQARPRDGRERGASRPRARARAVSFYRAPGSSRRGPFE